ncbi:hypothetical protein RCC89_02800 [Cytophagaceae bacterium ABcell3]|nr:hypothetical protein RCC89_02800 [Cytophagaceae bacterium ABcell3]
MGTKNKENQNRPSHAPGAGMEKIDMVKKKKYREEAGNPGDVSNAAGAKNKNKGGGDHYKYGSGPVSDKKINKGD